MNNLTQNTTPSPSEPAHMEKATDPNIAAQRLEAIARDTTALVSLPGVCIKINETIARDDYTAGEVGAIIAQDANLTALLLKLANSAFYGFPSRIATISRAVTIIGSRELRDLVLATSAIEAFNKIPIALANMNSFWMHSLQTGIVARIIAGRCRILHNERLFVAGLLHDIGHLALCLNLPDEAREAMLQAARTGRELQEAELEIIGFDHAMLGSALLETWKLPEGLVEAVRYHHNPFAAPVNKREAGVVYLANLLTKESQLGGSLLGKSIPIDARVWQLVGLYPDQCAPILDEAKRQFAEAMTIFLPNVVAKAR